MRARLLVTQVLLLAFVCAGIGIATELALQRFLTHQLDTQLLEAGRRSAAIFDMHPPNRPPPPPGYPPLPAGYQPPLPGDPPPPQGFPPPPPPGYPLPPDFPYRERFDPEAGPGPGFLNAPGQAIRTVGAVLRHDGSIDAGVITGDGGRADISAAAQEQLRAIAPNRKPKTVELDGLGGYRLVGLTARHGGQTIVVGLPTADVTTTLLWVLGMFCVGAVIALICAGAAGMLIIRRQLAPLSRVSDAARDVEISSSTRARCCCRR